MGQVEHLTVYRKDDIPVEYHYKNNRRTMPILLEAHEGFEIMKSRAESPDRGEETRCVLSMFFAAFIVYKILLQI